MTTRIFRALTLSLSMIAGQPALAEEAAPAAVTIVGAEFGIFDASDSRAVAFAPTRVVPHREGQRYGWVIEVQTARRSLSVREEYLLPNPVKQPKSDDPIVARELEAIGCVAKKCNSVVAIETSMAKAVNRAAPSR